jgi:hypothetical protein
MRLWNRIAIALGACLLACAPALASTILNVTQNGLTAPNANYGCPAGSANCLTSLDFQLTGTGAATGSIVLNSAGTLATISMDVASVTFATVPGGGTSDVFTNVHYSGTVSVFSTASVISQLAPGTGTVSGNLNGNPFSSDSAVYNLSCAISGATGQCGVAYGPQTFTVDGQNWLHTFDVVVTPVTTPEASTLLLVLLGAAGLTLRRR